MAETISQEEWRTLYHAVNESTTSETELLQLWGTLDDIFVHKVQPHPGDIKLLDRFFGTNIYQQVRKHLPFKKKAWDTFVDALNVRKAIRASTDLSAALRQAWMFSMAHPIKAAPLFIKQFRAFFSPEFTKLAEIERETNPLYPNLVRWGVQFTKIAGRTKGEELFVSELAHKIPGIGKVVQASDSAFVTFLNDTRMAAGQYYYEDWLGTGQPEIAYRQMGSFINHSTGRGGGKLFEKYSPELGIGFWAPRLTLGRFQTVGDLWKPHIRKLVAHELGRAFGSSMLALGLISMIGVLHYGQTWDETVEHNPISSDFGKGKLERTRFDFFGGYQQIMRLIAQLAWRQKKATATGRISDVDALYIIKRFLRSKLSPPAGLVTDIFTGETFEGKKWRWEPEFLKEYAAENTAPLFLQDLKEAIQYQGIGMGALVAPLAVHGVGAATYEPTARQEAIEMKNHYAHEIFGIGWDELGPDAQGALRESRPLIDLWEEKKKREQETYTYVGRMLEEEKEAGRKVRKSLSKKIQAEFDRLEVDVGNLRRRIGADWYLNKKIYKQYQENLKKVLEKIVPELMSTPGWNKFPSTIQKDYLEEVISECKKHVQQRIMVEATMKDLERL